MLGQLAQRIARFFQHVCRQIHATAAPVLSHVAQDVGQLHGHAQRHGVLAQPLRQRGMHVQERQQHEPDRPCHVVGVLFQVVQGGRLPEPQVATLPFQKVVERLRIHVEVLEHHGQGAPQRLVGHASRQEAVERPLQRGQPGLARIAVHAIVRRPAERVQRVHARALARGKQRERPVEAVRVAPDDLFAPREVVGALGEPVLRRHRAPPASVRSSRSSRISSCAASLALKSTMGTPAPGCVLLPQKYRRSQPAALLCGRQ